MPDRAGSYIDRSFNGFRDTCTPPRNVGSLVRPPEIVSRSPGVLRAWNCLEGAKRPLPPVVYRWVGGVYSRVAGTAPGTPARAPAVPSIIKLIDPIASTNRTPSLLGIICIQLLTDIVHCQQAISLFAETLISNPIYLSEGLIVVTLPAPRSVAPSLATPGSRGRYPGS